MHRTLLAALTICLAACAAPTTTTGGVPASGVRDTQPGAAPTPVAYGADVVHLHKDERGFRRPQLASEGCIERSLMHYPAAGGVNTKVKFAVLRDGTVTQFSFINPVSPAAAAAVEKAVAACLWDPGLGPDGRPVAVWVIVPLKVLGTPPEE